MPLAGRSCLASTDGTPSQDEPGFGILNLTVGSLEASSGADDIFASIFCLDLAMLAPLAPPPMFFAIKDSS